MTTYTHLDCILGRIFLERIERAENIKNVKSKYLLLDRYNKKPQVTKQFYIKSLWKTYSKKWLNEQSTVDYLYNMYADMKTILNYMSLTQYDFHIQDSYDPSAPLINSIMKAINFATDDKLKNEVKMHLAYNDQNYFNKIKPRLSIINEFVVDCHIILWLSGYYGKYDKYDELQLKEYYSETRDNIYWYIIPHCSPISCMLIKHFLDWCNIEYDFPVFQVVINEQKNNLHYILCQKNNPNFGYIDLYKEFYDF